MKFLEAFSSWNEMSPEDKSERKYLEGGIKEILNDLDRAYYTHHTGGWVSNKPYVWISSALKGPDLGIHKYPFKFEDIREEVENIESFLDSSGYDTKRQFAGGEKPNQMWIFFTEKATS